MLGGRGEGVDEFVGVVGVCVKGGGGGVGGGELCEVDGTFLL